MELIADTTFLIGLWRKQSWAVRYAGKNTGRSLGIPWIALGEFWHGAIRAGHDPAKVSDFLKIGMPVCDAAPCVERYARTCSNLQSQGQYREIGQNDLWLAAVAMTYDLPLVTRNRRHFDKIDGLKVEILADEA